MVKLLTEFSSLDTAIQMSIKECSNFTEKVHSFQCSCVLCVLCVYCWLQCKLVASSSVAAWLLPSSELQPGRGEGRQRDGCQLCSYVRHDTSRHYVIMHSGPAIRRCSEGRLEAKVTCVRPAALAS